MCFGIQTSIRRERPFHRAVHNIAVKALECILQCALDVIIAWSRKSIRRRACFIQPGVEVYQSTTDRVDNVVAEPSTSRVAVVPIQHGKYAPVSCRVRQYGFRAIAFRGIGAWKYRSGNAFPSPETQNTYLET